MIGNKYRVQGTGQMQNQDVKDFKNAIQELVDNSLRTSGFPTYKAAVVQVVNDDGTVDVYLPPNQDILVTRILNKCGEPLLVGDSVEIATKNGSLSNCWVAIKHGTNVEGNNERVEQLAGEVVLKVENGRLVQSNLDRDPILGNAFTIVADDINLDGMNIVLNGKRGITIESPYFKVTKDGIITSTGGNIGGWTIGDTRLYSGSGSNFVGLDSGTAGTNYAIWAGSSDAVSAPFRVSRSGAITSTSGNIGGWTINSTTLTGGNITLNSNGSIGGGSTYAWSIGTDGYATFNGITGNNANISGTITTGNLNATGGSIGGWRIDSVQFQKQIGEYSFEIRSDRPSNEPALLVYKNQGGGQGYKFYVRPDGYLYATSGSISGGLVSSGINASNITAGRLNISDGSGHYLRMGFAEGNNPSVSGLNVGSGGIACTSAGIRAYRFITEQDGYQYSGQDESIQIYDGHGKVWYLSFRGGILYASEYK